MRERGKNIGWETHLWVNVLLEDDNKKYKEVTLGFSLLAIVTSKSKEKQNRIKEKEKNS